MPPMDEASRAFTRFGAADLQVHTSHGDGMADARALFERIERTTDLDVMAVTDHDDVRGALLAREIHAQGHYHFEFVPGIEVTTRSGHLLALWIDQPVRSFRSLAETVATIHRLGGLAVVPHPLSYLTRSIGERALDRLLADADPETRPDGIEVANTSLAGRVTGKRGLRLNRERWGLAETGGSDAHFPEDVGSAWTLFPGQTAAVLRAAIEAHETLGVLGASTPLREIGVRRLAAQQVRGLATTPRKVLGPPVLRFARRMRQAVGV